MIIYNIFFKFYRFGKPRREPELNNTLSSEEDNSAEREREIARKNALNEQIRIQEQYERLKHRQQVEMVCMALKYLFASSVYYYFSDNIDNN